jgi:hypothetical protein
MDMEASKLLACRRLRLAYWDTTGTSQGVGWPREARCGILACGAVAAGMAEQIPVCVDYARKAGNYLQG